MSKKNLRSLLESTANAFDLNAVSDDLVADIQFRLSGKEPGDYYFHVENKKCNLHEGIAESPKATIKATSEVWEAILRGEMNPQVAFFRRKFTVEGDVMLLLSLANLFKAR